MSTQKQKTHKKYSTADKKIRRENKDRSETLVSERSIVEICPYCESKDFVKRGVRKNKHHEVQLYVCRNPECGRTFTARTIKGKQFPWPVILDAISYHNLGYTFRQCAHIIEAKFFKRTGVDVINNEDVTKNENKKRTSADRDTTNGQVAGQTLTKRRYCRKQDNATSAAPRPETIAAWYEEYKSLCRFERMRPYAMRILAAWRSQASALHEFNMVETITLAHRQLYRFRYHRPKTLLLLEEYKNRNFSRLVEYLDAVTTDTPHQYFTEGERMSEIRSKFNKAEMVVRRKTNFATRFAGFVLQGVPKNRDRHEVLQRFMIANDSVTVATEVPVYIRKEDVAHMEKVLKFKVTEHLATDIAGTANDETEIIYDESQDVSKTKKPNTRKAQPISDSEADNAPFATAGYVKLKGHKRPHPFPDLITGHIDIVQIRNGVVHILDYKPNADKEKPIEQLTWYALSLSRLTGLRLFEFKCAWFDEKSYYEFYPLHVVKKFNRKRRKKVRYRDGTVAAVPKENELHIIK